MHENKVILYDTSYKKGMFKMQWGFKVQAYSIFLGKWEEKCFPNRLQLVWALRPSNGLLFISCGGISSYKNPEADIWIQMVHCQITLAIAPFPLNITMTDKITSKNFKQK